MNSRQEEKTEFDSAPQQFESMAEKPLGFDEMFEEYDPTNPVDVPNLIDQRGRLNDILDRSGQCQELAELIELTIEAKQILAPVQTRAKFLHTARKQIESDLECVTAEQNAIREHFGLYDYVIDPTEHLITSVGRMAISKTKAGDEFLTSLESLRE